jgi:anti-sigma regulatory factor (Ser/Thr protein kinase)
MTAEALLELPPHPASAPMARAFVSRALHEWGCDQVDGRAAVAVSEVVTNAVRHTHSTARLLARYDGERVEVRVEDDDDSLPLIQQPEPDAEAGRGLTVVAALADHWGVEPLPEGGKVVYVAFDC